MKNVVSLSHRTNIPETPVKYSSKSLEVFKALLSECVSRITEFDALVKGKTVLVKPNLVRPNLNRLPAITTDARAIIAFCELLKEHSVKQIILGENSGYGLNTRKALHDAGLWEPMIQLGVNVIPFDEAPTVTVPNEDALIFKNVLIAKPVLDCDTLISFPKLKTHMHTLVTLGMKNLQGLVLDNQRLLYHRADLTMKIVDTVRIRPPDLTIIDGVWAMEGQAPFFGDVIKNFNCLLAGTDVVSVDATACRLMRIEPNEVAHIRLARQVGLTKVKDNEIEVLGESITDHHRAFSRPVVSSVGAFDGVYCLECGECVGCQSALRHSLDRLACEKRFRKIPLPLTIFLGLPMPKNTVLKEWRGQLFTFGDCARKVSLDGNDPKNVLHVAGCPPHVLDFYNLIKKIYG